MGSTRRWGRPRARPALTPVGGVGSGAWGQLDDGDDPAKPRAFRAAACLGTKKDGRAEMRIRPLCYAGVLGSVSEDHASRAIRQARCSPEEAGLCEYDTLRSLRIAVLPRRGTLHLYNR